jgi:hypothetical protein
MIPLYPIYKNGHFGCMYYTTPHRGFLPKTARPKRLAFILTWILGLFQRLGFSLPSWDCEVPETKKQTSYQRGLYQ